MTTGIKGTQIRDDSLKGVDIDEATLRLPLTTVTAAGTTDLDADTHHTVVVNVNSPDTSTIRLPAASGSPGKIFVIKRVGNTTVTISTVSGNIDGDSTWSLHTMGEGITVQSDGANWWVVAEGGYVSDEITMLFSNTSNAVSANDAVYISSNGTVSKALASDLRTCAIGVVSEVASSTSCRVLTSGLLYGFSSGMVAGDHYYLSPSTAGGLTTTGAGDPYIRQLIGVAQNATDLLVIPSVGQLNPSQTLTYELYNQSQGEYGLSGWWQRSSESYCSPVATTSTVGNVPTGYYVIAFDGTGDPVSLYNQGQSFYNPIRLSFRCQNGGGGSWPLPSGGTSYAFESGEFLYIQTSTDAQTWTTLGTTMYRSTNGGVSYSATGTAGAIQGTEVSSSDWYDFYIEVSPGNSENDYPYYVRLYFDVGHATDDCAITDVRFQFNPANLVQTIPAFPSSAAGTFVNIGSYGELSDSTGVFYDTTYGAAVNFDGNNIDLSDGALKAGSVSLLSYSGSKVALGAGLDIADHDITSGGTTLMSYSGGMVTLGASLDVAGQSILSGGQTLISYASGTDTLNLGVNVNDTVKIWGGAQTMGITTLGQNSGYGTTVKGNLTVEGQSSVESLTVEGNLTVEGQSSVESLTVEGNLVVPTGKMVIGDADYIRSHSAGDVGVLNLHSNDTTADDAAQLTFSHYKTSIASGANLGEIWWMGSEDDSTYNAAAYMIAEAAGTWTSTSTPSIVKIGTCPVDSTVASGEAIVIHSSKDVTIKGDLFVEGITAGGSTFAAWDTSNDQLYYYSSTEKIKSNIQPHDKGLLMLNAIRPVSFDMNNGETGCLGFIAEEVHAVDTALSALGPDFDYNEDGEPKRDEDGKKVLLSEGLVPISWDLPAMISVLVKSVQELSAKVEFLEAKVEELSGE
jgi:hypothetical protein